MKALEREAPPFRIFFRELNDPTKVLNLWISTFIRFVLTWYSSPYDLLILSSRSAVRCRWSDVSWRREVLLPNFLPPLLVSSYLAASVLS